jgi:hypothetical protein
MLCYDAGSSRLVSSRLLSCEARRCCATACTMPQARLHVPLAASSSAHTRFAAGTPPTTRARRTRSPTCKRATTTTPRQESRPAASGHDVIAVGRRAAPLRSVTRRAWWACRATKLLPGIDALEMDAKVEDDDERQRREARARLGRIESAISRAKSVKEDRAHSQETVRRRAMRSCRVLSCPVLSCRVLSCPVVSCRVLSCSVVSLLFRCESCA